MVKPSFFQHHVGCQICQARLQRAVPNLRRSGNDSQRWSCFYGGCVCNLDAHRDEMFTV